MKSTARLVIFTPYITICKYYNLSPLALKIYTYILLINIGVIGIAAGIQWLSLSKVLSVGSQPQKHFDVDLCNEGSYLTNEQRNLCRRYYTMMNSVVEGASMALNECQIQFSDERWNCSIQKRRRQKRSLFGNNLISGTREAAFVYAISSAAVAYSVTRDCSKGIIEDCGCDKTWPQHAQKSPSFEWGGCSDNIGWGKEMSRKFTDVQEHPQKEGRWRQRRRKKRKRLKNEITVNLNNNRMGRESVANSMRHQCKCHGVSSSCETVTCWRTLPEFRQVGRMLKKNYNRAVQVHVVKKRDRSILKPKRKVQRLFRKNHNLGLVFLRKSPDSCATTGRKCNPEMGAMNSCHKICCGRGHVTETKRVNTKCQCKFMWCCRVECGTCNTTVTEHTCR